MRDSRLHFTNLNLNRAADECRIPMNKTNQSQRGNLRAGARILASMMHDAQGAKLISDDVTQLRDKEVGARR